MASLNKVFLIGNLTKDPEVRRTPSGTAVTDLRLAVNRKFKSSSGENREETCFINATVWGRQAETSAEYLRKGSAAMIEGRLKYDEWEKDGQKHSRISVVAERVQFMGSPRGRGGGGDMGDAPTDNGSRTEPPGPPADRGDDDDLPF
jgi:single-strand DNA-binding protein